MKLFFLKKAQSGTRIWTTRCFILLYLELDLTRNGSKNVQKCVHRFVVVDSDFTAN